ncbi:LysR substrate-binding domain-containing protein [Pseudomonas typographi]|uniref:LysR family transcriptional regulator n=1 Tax=Pseudomonas typographi TaxID=2715964 RepID=A0ABR7Z9D6_9PSED|nr:LysR substrate-binding domain-containing protein [Pseudomonas typographi]MBD1587120.1 LysR family transcriptional regulator [Pseudomonas typographi]MBD1602180.1 LysR family transcriptional regulator [Pseudomonas typographi]
MATTLDIDLVRTFHAVARLGQFRAAAAHLHKSPAAVSVHIQRLEALAGGRLLERDNQAVTLTPLGERLLGTTRELLHTHDRVVAQLQGAQLAGRVTIGLPDEYAAHVIRDILPAFAATWPNVVLEVRTAPSYTLREQLARGALQLAVMACNAGAAPAQAQLLTATTPVWVGASSAMGQGPGPVPLALYAADCPYREAMLRTLKAHGRTWRVVLDSPSSQAINACVEGGLAVTLIDQARVTASMQQLQGMPTVAQHEVVLVRAPGAAGHAALELLAEAIGRYFHL